MRPPLDNWNSLKRGYRHGQPTFYSDFHLGVDVLVATGTPLYAPESGSLSFRVGSQGGNTLELTGAHTHRFMHLSRTVKQSGQVTEGELIAYTGNTGLSTHPHLHWDVRRVGSLINNRNNFLDPDQLKFGGTMDVNDPFVVEQRVHARADCLRFIWQLLNPNLEVAMEDIYRDAWSLERKTKTPQDLLNGWMKTAIERGFWVKGEDAQKNIKPQVLKMVDLLRDNIAKL